METTYDSYIEQITQDIFATMLHKAVVRVDEPPPADREALLATIQIAGEWMGSVVLALSPEVARDAAITMLSLNEHEATDADQQEVAAELVNMVGGNLKSLLPAPSFLSLPTIVSGTDFGLHMHDTQLIDDVSFACETGLLRVRLYAKL